MDTIRTVLSIAANEKLELAQFDVKTAFLDGIIEEEIYMQQPEGYEDNSQRVCRLRKSVYGLKQSPRTWNKRFKDVLINFGLQESTADPCLFYRITEKDKLIVTLYVDDGLVVATKKISIEEFLSRLKEEFKITAEPIGCFLNILIDRRDDGSIVISQKRYTEDILRRFNMEQANSVSTPIEKCQMTREEENANTANVPHREAVGCLMHLAVATHPDIAFAVSYVSQFLKNPEDQYWSIVKRIFKYLKSSTTMSIKYNAANNNEELESYSDADYASDQVRLPDVQSVA